MPVLRLIGPLIGVGLGCSIAASAYGQSSSTDVVQACRSDSLQQAAAHLEGRRCFESVQGWFFTTDSAWAARMSAAIGEVSVRFQKVFGDSLGRGAVLHAPGSERGENAELKKIFPNASWTYTSPVEGKEPGEFTGLERHEMGHVWFTLWSKRHGAKDTLPDWIHETPAILMEDSAVTATRYQNMETLPSQGASLIPLGKLFTMKNPVVGVVRSGNANPMDIMQGELFYDECRSLLDFLAARTGDLSVFGSIAQSVIQGSTVGQWLQANGSRYGLPTTVQELEKEWRSWLP